MGAGRDLASEQFGDGGPGAEPRGNGYVELVFFRHCVRNVNGVVVGVGEQEGNHGGPGVAAAAQLVAGVVEGVVVETQVGGHGVPAGVAVDGRGKLVDAGRGAAMPGAVGQEDHTRGAGTGARGGHATRPAASVLPVWLSTSRNDPTAPRAAYESMGRSCCNSTVVCTISLTTTESATLALTRLVP